VPATPTHPELTTGELFRLALREQDDATRKGTEEDLSYLVALHERPSESTFQAAARFVMSDVASERRLGIRVLKELGQGLKPFEEESLDVLVPRLAHLDSSEELRETVSAIGWQNRPRSLPILLSFVDHSDVVIRCLVAQHLPGCSLLPDGGADQRGIDALVRLTQDPDGDVRYCATASFEIDYPELDSEAIRAALDARTRDDDPIIRRSAEQALRARGLSV
jgi:hypothetical protein